MLRFFAAACLLALLAPLPPAAGADMGEAVKAADEKWAASVVAQDFDALDDILHDDLIYAHSTGIIESKSEYLGKLKSGRQRYDAIDHHETTIRVFGDAAVAHSIVTMKGATAGEPFDNKLMMIHTWVKDGDEWRLAAHQTTRLAE